MNLCETIKQTARMTNEALKGNPKLRSAAKIELRATLDDAFNDVDLFRTIESIITQLSGDDQSAAAVKIMTAQEKEFARVVKKIQAECNKVIVAQISASNL
jgi:hypothetical protein